MLSYRILTYILLCAALPLIAEEKEAPQSTPLENACSLKEKKVETKGSVTIGGKSLPYKATTGTLILRDETCKEKASIFYVAYTKEGEEDKRKRPIAFCTNGGPGSCSVWLHLGVLGPKRVYLNEVGASVPPYYVVNNEESILDELDLVFIDPVSTGYSRPAPGEDAKQFHGVAEDVEWVGKFIRLYLTQYERWQSPKFFIGESYGTTRAAALVNYLHNEELISFNGIALVSAVLNFQAHQFDTGNDLAYLLSLPSYATTAWYHKTLSPDLQADFAKLRAQAEHFALNDYALALLKGDQLSSAEQEAAVAKFARLTSLSPEYIKRSNMRVDIFRFAKELLRQKERTVGRFDSRFTGIDSDAAGEHYEYDPSADAFFCAFTAAFNDYVRADLKWETEEPYKILSDVQPWSYGKATNKYLNVAEHLREVMTRNPRMRVFLASGYYDLATPYFASDYTFDHLGLDPSLRGHVDKAYYEAGHMMYIHKPSLIKFKQDLARFIRATLEEIPPSVK